MSVFYGWRSFKNYFEKEWCWKPHFLRVYVWPCSAHFCRCECGESSAKVLKAKLQCEMKIIAKFNLRRHNHTGNFLKVIFLLFNCTNASNWIIQVYKSNAITSKISKLFIIHNGDFSRWWFEVREDWTFCKFFRKFFKQFQTDEYPSDSNLAKSSNLIVDLEVGLTWIYIFCLLPPSCPAPLRLSRNMKSSIFFLLN